MAKHWADFQYEIYLNGMTGAVPRLPTDLTRLEELTEQRLGPGPVGYVAGSAGNGSTARANREALDRRRIVPRMLRDVHERDLSVEVLGRALPAPLALAPVGVLSIMHPDAESAAARAAAAQGVPYILSSASSTPMEQVAEAMGDAERWFQLYWAKDREVTRSFLDRAKAAGYTALFVTLDTPLLAWRPRDLDQAYLPFLHGIGTANHFSDPAFQAGLAKPVHEDPNAAVMHFVGMFADPGKTWPDLAFLRENWDGPIVLKGILHPDDARRAADAGMDGVVVSNHGGRQVAGSVAAADALPRVVEAVGDRLTVLFDSGIRTGDDIFKALALGARAVLVGRPYAYGLGLDGQAGVEHVIRCLLAEFDLTLALSGHSRPMRPRPRRPDRGNTVKNVLAVVSAHVGGRTAGAALAGVFPGEARVTVVETTDEDPGALREAQVIITGLAPVTAGHLAAAPDLELVQCASHGFDYVDLDAARAKGVPVCNIGSSGAEKQNVAEQTFALMLALAKQLIPAHTALVDADWALPRLQRSITELSGKTLGIIGLGHIGEEVARRAVAFDMSIVYAGPQSVGAEAEARLGAPATSNSTNCCGRRTTSRCTRRSPRRPGICSMPNGWRS